MPRRLEADQLEWNLRKEDILKLYVEQNEPLSEVMRAMDKQGFTRTKPQYERSFKRWRVSKNVRKSEWNFILGRLNERKRPTNVKVRGVAISQTRIELQRLRQRETTLGRCMSQFRPQPRSPTPDDVEISSPAPESSIEDHQLGERRYQELELREPNTESSGDFVESLGTLERDPSLQPVSESVASAVPTTILESGFEHVESTLAVASVGRSSQSSTTPSFCPGPLHDYIRHWVLEFAYLEIEDGKSKEDVLRDYLSFIDQDFSRVGHPVLKVFLKHAIPQKRLHMIARDLDNKHELSLLQSLLLSGRDFAIWVAFSLSLLHAAVVDGNLPLVDVVSQTGIDIDARLPLDYRHDLRGKCVLIFAIPEELTPLQIAVLCRREAVVEALSGLGATILTGNRDRDWRFLKNAYGHGILLQPLLSRLAAARSATARRGIRLLDLAVRRAEVNMIGVLLKAGFSPYLSLRDGIVDFPSITTFEQVSRKVDTPFMAALDMCREEFLRLDKDSMSELRSAMIMRLLSSPNHNLVYEQRSSQIQQVALAYALAVFTNNHELWHALIGKTGLDQWEIVRTVHDHGWNLITKVGPIPSPWVVPEIEAPRQDGYNRWAQISL